MSIGRFYAAIVALLRSEEGKYLLLKRSPKKDFAAGAWECVTGRVDQGEGFPEAVHREVDEELGVKVQIEFIVGTFRFHRGEPVPENELLGVAYRCTIDDPESIQISAEHSEYRWVTAEEAERFLPEEAGWLKEIIRRAELMRRHLPDELKEHLRATEMDIS